MNRFSYTKAHTVSDALDAFNPGNGSKFIAGGTNLIDLMRIDVERPGQVIDINGLDIGAIEDLDDGGLRLGALAKNADTAYDERVQKRYPLLAKAILAGASPQLRNMATNGGNLLQRTRCYYFYDNQTPCNKRVPGQGCSAIQGYNRMHAILGSSEHCIATHPSDMCVALAALEARVKVIGDDGERIIPFSDFHRLPGDLPQKDTNVLPGELITAIELPAESFAPHYQYIKVRDRRSYAFALVSVAAALQLEGGTIKKARIALGGVAHKPWRDQEAEQFLEGKPAEESVFRGSAAIILQGAKGFRYNQFKIELARRAVVRALTEARDRTVPEPLNCYTYNRHQKL